MSMSIKVVGLEKVISKLSPSMLNGHLGRFFTRASIIVQNHARENAMERAHDTGQLVNSILTEVDKTNPPLYAKIGHLNAQPGSTLWYKATGMEYGTGLLAEGPNAKGKRHWPPAAALDVWAKRHGFRNGAIVARIIGLRGGLRPRRYLRDALKDSLSAIQSELARIGNEIKAEFDS
jgi:hypothetical protein